MFFIFIFLSILLGFLKHTERDEITTDQSLSQLIRMFMVKWNNTYNNNHLNDFCEHLILQRVSIIIKKIKMYMFLVKSNR